MRESVRQTAEARALRLAYRTPATACHALVARIPDLAIVLPEVRCGYEPAPDLISLTHRNALPELLHEVMHAVWHQSRLNVPALTTCTPFGLSALAAEVGASYLGGLIGLTNAPEPCAETISRGWVAVLRADPRILPTAVEAAACAVTYILRR